MAGADLFGDIIAEIALYLAGADNSLVIMAEAALYLRRNGAIFIIFIQKNVKFLHSLYNQKSKSEFSSVHICTYIKNTNK